MSTRLDLVIESFGTSLRLRGERLVVEQQGQTLGQYALKQLGSVRVIDRGVSLSSDVIVALSQHGVLLHISDFAHRPVVHVSSPMLSSRARTRSGQLMMCAAQEGQRLAVSIVAEKLRAQRRLLVFTRRRSDRVDVVDGAIERLSALEGQVLAMEPSAADSWTRSLMGFEGAGAAAYWPALASTSAWVDEFRRVKRGAPDPVNASLNYGYSILYSRLWGMCERAGLDPFVGFLHGVEPGRINLVLDVIEPWRVIVDDAVFSLLRRRRSPLPDELDQDLKRALVQDVTSRLLARSEYEGQVAVVQSCMQRCLRDLARHFDGEREQWPIYRWDVRGPRVPEGAQDSELLDEIVHGYERKR